MKHNGACLKFLKNQRITNLSLSGFLFTSINADGKGGDHLWVNAHGNFSFARLLDWLVELNGVTVDDDACSFEFLVDVDVGNGTECLATLAGGKDELRLELGNLGGDFLSGHEFFSLTACTLGLESLDVAQVGTAGFISLALWDEEIAGVASTDLYDICFGTKAFDFFFENDLSVGHERRGSLVGAAEVGPGPLSVKERFGFRVGRAGF